MFLPAGEFAAATTRCSTLTATTTTTSQAYQSEAVRLKGSYTAAQMQVESMQRAANLTRMRCGALERYMDLVLKINGDLTKRISDTAEARAQLR